MKKVKKIIALIIVIILLSAYIPSIKAYEKTDNIKITLSTENLSLEAGNKIAIDMNMELNEENVDSIGATINYDPEILSFDVEEEFTTSTDTKWNAPDYNDNEGTLMIETSRGNSSSGKAGKMFTFYFNVLKTVESTTISIEDPVNCAYLGKDLWCEGSILELPKAREKYNMQYDSNTEEIVNNMPENGTKIQGIEYVVEGNPVREGYTFAGWSINKNGTGIIYNEGSKYTTDADVIFYAQWKVNSVQEDGLYLRSDHYNIGNIDTTKYQEGDLYISKILPETTLETFKANCNTNGKIVIYKTNGEQLNNNEYIGTNMKLEITKDNQKIELTIAVIGDLDGNGKITITDLVRVNQNILGDVELNGAYEIAGDVDFNGKITITDLSRISDIIIGNVVL